MCNVYISFIFFLLPCSILWALYPTPTTGCLSIRSTSCMHDPAGHISIGVTSFALVRICKSYFNLLTATFKLLQIWNVFLIFNPICTLNRSSAVWWPLFNNKQIIIKIFYVSNSCENEVFKQFLLFNPVRINVTIFFH